MTELVEPLCGVNGSFKSSDLIPLKTTESMGYDAVPSFEWLISSEKNVWSAHEYVGECLCVTQRKRLDTVINIIKMFENFLTYFFTSVLGKCTIK